MSKKYFCLKCNGLIKPKTPKVAIRPHGQRKVFHFHANCYDNLKSPLLNSFEEAMILVKAKKEAKAK